MATGDIDGGVINMHITIKGGMASNYMGVESISGVRMVWGAHNEGNKGIELSVLLLCGKVGVKLFMNVLDEDSKGRPGWRWNSEWK